MNADEYRAYLTSPHWRTLRAHTLKAHGHRCQACRSAHALHVHHRNYSRLGNEHPDDLRVLCEDCHHLVHDTQHERDVPLTEATDLVTATARTRDDEDLDLMSVLPTMFALLNIRAENQLTDQ